jgi:hypothetical protein
VARQSYPNITHVIGWESDDTDTRDYVTTVISEHIGHPSHHYAVVGYPPGHTDQGAIFFNGYFTRMHEFVREIGAQPDDWVTYLDDDDMFTSPGAVQVLMDAIDGPHTRLVVGRLQMPSGEILPPDEAMGCRPVYNSTSGSGWMFRVKDLDLVKWRTDVHSNYLAIQGLYDRTEPWEVAWTHAVVAQLQRPEGIGGLGARDDQGEAGTPDHSGLDGDVHDPLSSNS